MGATTSPGAGCSWCQGGTGSPRVGDQIVGSSRSPAGPIRFCSWRARWNQNVSEEYVPGKASCPCKKTAAARGCVDGCGGAWVGSVPRAPVQWVDLPTFACLWVLAARPAPRHPLCSLGHENGVVPKRVFSGGQGGPMYLSVPQ